MRNKIAVFTIDPFVVSGAAEAARAILSPRMRLGAKAWLLPILVWCAVAPASPADRNWPTAMLAAHNRVRATLHLPPLRWSDRLAAVAYEWAMILLRTSAFEHRHPNRYGENLFEIRGGSRDAKDVLAAWAAEARDY